MKKLGLSQRFITESTLYTGLYIGRVISQYKDLYKIATENGELAAEISGKFRFTVKFLSDYPEVGDFVMLDRNENTSGNAIIHHVLTRKSAFIRKAAGTSNNEQIVAAKCKFHDCTHRKEPNCAVQKAIHAGLLAEERFVSYGKLQKEAQYEGLNSKQIETEKITTMFAEVGGMKNARKLIKSKHKKR